MPANIDFAKNHHHIFFLTKDEQKVEHKTIFKTQECAKNHHHHHIIVTKLEQKLHLAKQKVTSMILHDTQNKF